MNSTTKQPQKKLMALGFEQISEETYEKLIKGTMNHGNRLKK